MTLDEALAKIAALEAQIDEMSIAHLLYEEALEANRKWFNDSTLWHLDGCDDKLDEASARFYAAGKS